MKFWVVAKEGLLGQEMYEFLHKKKIPLVGSIQQEVDILNKEALSKFCAAHVPTHIVNCAAYVNVDEAEGIGKESAYAVNVQGVKNLVELAKERGIRLIHISTDYVFDGKKGGDYSESDPTHPINVYGETKLKGEEEVLKYEKGLILRTASIYGHGKPGIISGILDTLKTKERARHIADQVSTPTYTKDLVEAIFAIREEAGIFHFTNRGDVSRYGLLVHLWHLAQELGIPIKCKEVNPISQKEAKRAAIRPERSVLSIAKIEPFLEKRVRTWECALREYMNLC